MSRNIKELAQEIDNCLKKGDVKKSLVLIAELIDEKKYTKYTNEIEYLNSKFSTYDREKSLGLKKDDETLNQILYAIIVFWNEIKERLKLNKDRVSIESELKDLLSPNIILIEGGVFQMGSEKKQDELPIRKIYLDNFWISKFPIRFKEYDTYCRMTDKSKPEDDKWGRVDNPVIHVSWLDALNYCNWLSNIFDLEKVYVINGDNIKADFSKNGFRLPTEAEWEYAARGGNKSKGFLYSGSNEVVEVAWFDEFEEKIHNVGLKKPNELGIHDMSGNVWEWCWDSYRESYDETVSNNPIGPLIGVDKVVRGGCHCCSPFKCRVTNRRKVHFMSKKQNIGFRIVRNHVSIE